MGNAKGKTKTELCSGLSFCPGSRKTARGITALAAIAALSCLGSGCRETSCTSRIEPRHTREEIETIVHAYNTPEEAYEYVAKNVQFKKSDIETYKCPDRWNSLQETLATGVGDCEDGAIAFAALLSDNPEYIVEIKKLVPRHKENQKKTPSHAIAAYCGPAGGCGYASFSDFYGAKTSRFENEVYGTLEEAVENYSAGTFFLFYNISFTGEELKFGSALQKLLFDRTSKIAREIK